MMDTFSDDQCKGLRAPKSGDSPENVFIMHLENLTYIRGRNNGRFNATIAYFKVYHKL